MTALAPNHQQQSQVHPNHSIMEDLSDDDIGSEDELSQHDQHFYDQQQQQAMYYQQHQQHHQQQQQQQQQQHQQQVSQTSHGEDEGFSDDESSTASIPDDNINFSWTYALHTFLATVEGQASVVKGDSLLLLDDANSYWWLVRVLKTEDVGYIPAENIETPYERLARLNKHRNVDLAAATTLEKQAGDVQGRERLKGTIAGKSKGARAEKSGGDGEDGGSRKVFFAPPTYVEHPGVTWSSDEEDEGSEGEYDEDEEEEGVLGAETVGGSEGVDKGRSMLDMEPDDGVEWADGAGAEEQRKVVEQKQGGLKPNSNNPFAQQTYQPVEMVSTGLPQSSGSSTSLNSTSSLDPAQAGNDVRRITVTPAVAQGGGAQLPSALASKGDTGSRNVSGQSVISTTSVISTASSSRSTESQQDEVTRNKMKKSRKTSKEDLDGGEKKKSKGMLGGLFSRKGKDKKGISSNDPRSSEDSIVSGAVDTSPASQERPSEEAPRLSQRVPTPAELNSASPPQVSAHGMRLQQRDQALQQAYTSKYLTKSSSSEDAGVSQSSAAMRLAVNGTTGSKRPSSIIASPNPAAPLLNVMRIFAGEHIKSDASFKTVLLNETTLSSDLIRQAMQRFHLHSSSSNTDNGYYLTVKDVTGEEMELTAGEKPLAAFQEAVQRWSEDDDTEGLNKIAPTVKRSSISSISSVMSLSSHPAIAKLGMNDFSDDSTVKIYLNRRRPGSQQPGVGMGMPESHTNSEFSSYSTQLSTVQESSPEKNGSEWSGPGSPPDISITSDHTASPTTPQPRYNPSLTINTTGQASPERYSSPSARFTLLLIIHPGDLPDTSAFDPNSDAIVSKTILRDRNQGDGHSQGSRKRLLVLPRNVTVLEAIEQGLERFGIQEGVVDGGDDVEERGGKRIGQGKVRYSLTAMVGHDEKRLMPSSKILDAYTTSPTMRPMERTTMEQRRRSRDMLQSQGSAADILPTDPTFVLRRVAQRGSLNSTSRINAIDGAMQRQQQGQTPQYVTSPTEMDSRGPLSPQEIIAAQRAASRANQKALISAQANQEKGVDVTLPDRGTIRSSRLIEGNGEVVRYSYIDGDGETYDISELLEEEWGDETANTDDLGYMAQPPSLTRQTTDSSVYITAPSTPVPTEEERDILRGVLQRAAGQPESKLEEKLSRVINKVKSGSLRPTSSIHDSQPVINQPDLNASISSSTSGRQTPLGSGRTTPQPRVLAPLPEGRTADITPRASDSRSNSRQAGYQNTVASVNRIISRHRQQPSIASIMSDLSVPPGIEADDDGGTSTPNTATSSTHPTPPLHGAVFMRSVSSASATPRAPVVYRDDFGMKALMAIIDVRSREKRRVETAKEGVDGVEKMFWGEKVDWEGVHPEIKGCFVGIKGRLEGFDREIDGLLADVERRGKRRVI